ncbi:MAG: VanW family protein [Patescibacteria group bacterium]|nr:VanW family protein [Patescibacteria group bacterium]
MKEERANFKIYLFFILISTFLLCYFFINYQKKFAKIILTDLYLGNDNLKGLSKEEVRDFLEKKINQIEKEGIKIFSEKKEMTLYPVVIALNDPDLTRRIIHFKLEETIEEIFLSTPNKFPFLALKGGIKKIPFIFTIDEEEILKIVKSNFKTLEKEAKEASLKYEGGEWKIVPEEEGLSFNYQKVISDLKENLANLDLKKIVIEKVPQQPEIRQKDIEFSLAGAEKIVNLAPVSLFYGKERWIITKENLKDWLIFKKDGGKINFDLDQEKIMNFLEKIALVIDRPVQEAKFKMENNRVVEFQLAKEGRKLEIEKSGEKIRNYIFANLKEIELEVTLEKPSIFIEDINQLGIKELVGRGESDFKGSPKNRIHNIKIGAKTLNGILIKPNEEFSLLRALGEITEEKGYLPELVIKGNRTVPELGGGLCQIGTTAFRLALNAGLPITQRVPHAFRVIYYEPAGVDATIYHPSPDFKFINDYSSWLLLQTKIEGTKLIFELYGTADGRKVEVSPPKIFNVVSPGPPKYIETEELPAGEKKKVEKAVAGAETEFSRVIIYPNGEKKEEVWKSHYKPWPEVWLIGKEKTEPLENENQTN